LRAWACRWWNTDVIARELVQAGQPLLQRIVEEFDPRF
jgi:dephospho-CoA kinase